MRVEEKSYGPATVLFPEGTIDLSSSPEFQERLVAAIARHDGLEPLLVVDMTGVSFISSAGLRALLVAAKRTQSERGKLAVASLTKDVAEVFQISRFDLVVRVFDAPAAALAWMSAEAAAAWERR